jgi:RND family efflux transporter MFP subunit
MRISWRFVCAGVVPACLAAVLAWSVGCNQQPSGPPGGGEAKDGNKGPVKVATTKPVRKSLTYKIDGPGEIRPDEETPIYAKISGYAVNITKDIGDRVQEGDVLMELSVPDMDEELKQKEAAVVLAKKEVERARKAYNTAKADLAFAAAKIKEAEAGRPKAKAEVERAEELYARLKKSSSAISQEALAEYQLGVEVAKAAAVEVEARIESAKAWKAESEAKLDAAEIDIGVAEARVVEKEAAARHMAELLKYAKLPAPFKGVVTKRNVDTRHFVQSSISGAKGEPLFVVSKMDPVRVFVDVPENDAVYVTDGIKAVVRVQALEGEDFVGTVKRSSWSLDAKGRILRAEVNLPNPDFKLRPWMYAYTTITVVHDKVLAVPQAALVTKDDQTFCYVVENGKAVRTRVLTGLRDSHFAEVTKKRPPGQEGAWQNFTGAEEIVVSNPSSLTDGQAVVVSQQP